MSAKLLFLAGSARKDSHNKKLAKAASKMAEGLGATVTYIDLADYPMPIFCEDIESEQGLPDTAKKLKQLFIEHDGFLITTPEYNSSFTPLLKNSIDWISRPENKDEPRLAAFSGKTGAITGASPGALGGLRALVPLRMLLSNIFVHVIPNQFALGSAHDAFNEDGTLKDDGQNTMLKDVVKQLVETAEKHKG